MRLINIITLILLTLMSGELFAECDGLEKGSKAYCQCKTYHFCRGSGPDAGGDTSKDIYDSCNTWAQENGGYSWSHFKKCREGDTRKCNDYCTHVGYDRNWENLCWFDGTFCKEPGCGQICVTSHSNTEFWYEKCESGKYTGTCWSCGGMDELRPCVKTDCRAVPKDCIGEVGSKRK